MSDAMKYLEQQRKDNIKQIVKFLENANNTTIASIMFEYDIPRKKQ